MRYKGVKRNSGFTLVELIVTLAVTAILLSASVAGIVAWVHHADFVRNENYAETIYYAAQSELTRYRGNGQLAELEEYVKKAGQAVPAGEKLRDDYRAVLTGTDLTNYNERYDGRLYYLKKDAGPIDEDNPLGGLLSDYIYDGSIMDGTVCVEFDPADGTVYSVTYSDRKTTFTYSEGTADETAFSLLDRTRETRKKNRVGYYSVELSEAAPNAVGKTRIEKVELINEEQLYLRWSLPERYRGIRGFLSYTIQIYQKAQTGGADELKYSFIIRGNELAETNSIITCRDSAGGTGEEYQFMARMDESGVMYLVLDSIDYGAEPGDINVKIPGAENLSFDTAALKNSASILQLFAEPEDIYIKVQAQGRPYKTSAWKQSNTSNTMFASMKEETDADTYTIENSRHLYNIRYREQESESSLASGSTRKVHYQQTADITWMSDEGKLFHSTPGAPSGMVMGPLKDTDKCVPAGSEAGTASVPCFPALPFLEKNSTLEVSGSGACELINFVLCQKETAEVPGESTANKPLGLIAENRGTVQGLTLTNVNVQGVENVGAVCGVNSGNGKIWNTTVSGTVTGVESVGGIVGADQSTAPGEDRNNFKDAELENSSCKNLTNYAEVTGNSGKIGGVVGSMGEYGRAYLCKNYGAAKGTESRTVYIGGITGYNEGVVQNCTSAPNDAPVRDGSGELQQTALKGIFVGGIVGCNNGGLIKESGTEKENKTPAGKTSEAYVIGYRYVGGIVGYNNGAVNGGNIGTLVNDTSSRSNKAKVIGHDYVGGIVGANGHLDEVEIIKDIKNLTSEDKKKFEECDIKEEYSARMVVENWTNEGIVEAVGSVTSDGTTYDEAGFYAGGIAGYNAGDLKGCTTRVNTSSGGASELEALLTQVRLYGKDASYVGGIAGYNVGYIFNDSGTISVNSVVSGKKYVGGIVGYNGTAAPEDAGEADKSGRIRNYALSGGYISAESYAGGYVGLNTTEKLLGSGNTLTASPNEVTADYFAGGVMGALILVPESNVSITVSCATDNLFGKVTAENAFAGGYVGYTQLLNAGEVSGYADAKSRAEALYEKITTANIQQNIKSTDAVKRQEALQALTKTVLDEREVSDLDYNHATVLEFKYESGVIGENRLEKVKAPVFAGGVIGCNSWNTGLLLQNINNKVKVIAEDSVTYDFISMSQNIKDGESNTKQDSFSFAGGIIGLVTPYATIDNCGNTGAGDVDGKGTYGGGIAEVNLGTIRNCTVESVSNRDYYGGIAGLNTNGGEIDNCHLEGQISGESYLGGIAAVNESIITRCTVSNSIASESAVIGTGNYIGGIAAVSRIKKVVEEGGAEKSYANRIENCSVMANIGVENMGEAVGGLLGRYEGGKLSAIQIWDGDIYGVDRIGGIVGEIAANLIGPAETESLDARNKITSYADIHASEAAGGIGGKMEENMTVSGCQNGGKIISTAGLAGGIVPEIATGSCVIDCRNTGGVEAVNNIAGGITAKNNGLIRNCTVTEGDSADDAASEIKGKEAIGGVAGENRGNIDECRIIGNVVVSDVNALDRNRAIGGIAGRNTGVIYNSAAEKKDGKSPQIYSLSEESYLGGIAGTNIPDKETNSGIIQRGIIDLEVRLNNGQNGTVGGAVGANAGDISEITFSGTVAGTAGRKYGTGGIAGRNEMTEANKVGGISNCKLSGGVVSAVSDSGFGGYYDNLRGVYVGGICGVNPEKGNITGCSLEGNSYVLGNYGYVGGITAYNLGKLENNISTIENKNDKDKNPKICSGIVKSDGTINIETKEVRCVVGGIAGCNDVSGIIEKCTTGAWMIENSRNAHGERFPTGGIIGCNKSIHDQKELVNNAEVHGDWMTGGVIGQQFTEQRGGFTIEKCENHGKIIGEYRCAGGIISDWRERSGKVRECINFGEVIISTRNELNGAGGIIGTGWNGTAVTITIERCGNEGKIIHDETAVNELGNSENGAAGGIFGVYNPPSGLTLNITDCYNAAEIQNANGTHNRVSAGIFAGDERAGRVDLMITRCVNYGRGTFEKNLFAGIASKNASSGTKIVQQCLNVGECYADQKPIAYNMPWHDGTDNYYFSNPEEKSGFAGNQESRGRQVAEVYNGNRFNGITENENQVTYFDLDTNRLYLPDHNKYLQFTNVSGTYEVGGDQGAIESLKKNFSAYDYDKKTGDKYALLLFGMEKGEFGAPRNVVLEEADGTFRVSYEGNPDTIFCTAGYELEVYGYNAESGSNTLLKSDEIKDPSQNTWSIDEETLFKGVDKTQYTKIWARVRAKKAEGYEGITIPPGADPGYSLWTNSGDLETRPKLPIPQIHFEVTSDGEENQMCGYWVLDNIKDYESYNGEWEIILENVGAVGPITATQARSNLATYTLNNVGSNSGNTITVTAYASPTGSGYSRSDNFEKMLNWYPKGATLKAQLADEAQKGEFIGTEAGELSYRFRLKQSGANYQYVNITCMAEFWFDGKRIGESTVVLPNQQGEEYCTIDLSSVDQDTIRDIIENINQADSTKAVEFCFYLWEMENVKYYVTSDNTDPSRTIQEAAKNNEKAFNEGYVSYRLNGLTNYRMHPAPVPGDKFISTLETDGTITYTLYWDATESNGKITPKPEDDYKDADYVVIVTGKTGDTEILLKQQTVTSNDDKPNQITLTENNWKYEKLILNVKRLGKEPDGTDYVHYIGASADKEYDIPIRLSSISKPNAKLHDRHGLVFDLSWVRSGETGAAGYRIIMRGKKADGSSISPVTVSVDGAATDQTSIDLGKNEYQSLADAREIEFSVVVASGDSGKYLDSRESAVVLCEIPERLDKPKGTSELKLDGNTVDTAVALLPEKFTELALQVEDSTASSEDAAYEVEYFVADKATTDSGGVYESWDQTAGDRPALNPDSGIYISSDPVAMVGNLREATYMLNQPGNFNAEQAGRRLWYRIRAVSNSKISSVWTDWTFADLPKALLKPVEIPEDQTADREYSYTISNAGENYSLFMRQPKLGFVPREFAKGYEIYIKEADRIEYVYTGVSGQIEEKNVGGTVHIYTLEAAETAADGTPAEQPLILKGGDGTVIAMEKEDGQPANTGETIWYSDLYNINHSFKIESSGRTFIYTITTTAKLCYRVKEGAVQEIWLELPEGAALADDGSPISGRKFAATALVDITVTAPDRNRYEIAELTRWRQEKETDTDDWKITIEYVDVTAASGSRMAMEGYYENVLNVSELGDRELQMFGLERLDELFLDEETAEDEETFEENEKETGSDGRKDVSGNNTVSGNNAVKKAGKTKNSVVG